MVTPNRFNLELIPRPQSNLVEHQVCTVKPASYSLETLRKALAQAHAGFFIIIIVRDDMAAEAGDTLAINHQSQAFTCLLKRPQCVNICAEQFPSDL